MLVQDHSKVLDGRLKSVMLMVISENQSGFNESENITDNLITLSSGIEWMKHKRRPRALFKIDFKVL